MKKENSPLVSIGLMVFNAEKFLRKTIESLLAQDYENIEIIICDNASEDSTGDICKEYAKKDKRIKYYRNDKNIVGGSGIKAFKLSSGKYFMWAADHDMYHPTFISKLAKVLEEDPNTVLCYPQAIVIDENDTPLPIPLEDIDTRGLTVTDRFKKIIWELDWCNMFYGLYRHEALHKVTLNRLVLGTDRVLMAELTLHGSIAQVMEPLFYSRRNRPDEAPKKSTERRMQWLSETEGFNRYDILIPRTLMAYEHIKVIENSELTNDEKALLSNETIQCFKKRFKKTMGHESELLVKDGLNLLTGQIDDQAAICIHAINLMRLVNIVQLFYPDHKRLNILRAACLQTLDLHQEAGTPLRKNLESLMGTKDIEKLLLTVIERKGKASSRLKNKDLPLVSIGLMVFNAEKFLRKTIESLLAQDYENIEIIICDNASEDSTGDICKEYAKKDKRIKYYRNDKNIGGASGIKAFKLSSGKYFMWAADHDMYHPTFISKLAKVLREDPSVVLCYPQTVFIDTSDSPTAIAPDTIDTRGLNRTERFKKIIWELNWCNMFYGLYRLEQLKKINLGRNVLGADNVILAEISLLGAIAQVSEPLYYRRNNRPDETPEETYYRRIKWLSETEEYYTYNILIPNTHMAFEHIKVIENSDLTIDDKTLLTNEIIQCFKKRYEDKIKGEIEILAKSGMDLLGGQTDDNVATCIHALNLMRLVNIVQLFYPNNKRLNYLRGACFIKLGLTEESKASLKRKVESLTNAGDIQNLLLALINGEETIANKVALEKRDKASTQMEEKEPLVSIGLMVFNAEKFLRKTIESLLAQDYENTEIIICDNASEDSTGDICKEYAEKDKRIKYYRNSKNIGSLANFKKTFSLSSGEYFMAAADHDLWSPQFIRKCLNILINDPSVVLAYGRTVLIDEKGSQIKLLPDILDTRNLNPVESFKKMIWELEYGNMGYGLHRADIIRKSMPFPVTMGADIVVLCRMSLTGAIAQIDEPLWFRRTNREKETHDQSAARWKEDICKYGEELSYTAPWLMMANAHMESVIHSHLSKDEKSILIHEVIKSCVTRFGQSMQNEIKTVAANALASLIEGTTPVPKAKVSENNLLKLSNIANTFFPSYEESSLLSTIACLKTGEKETAISLSRESINKFPKSATIKALSNYINHRMESEWETPNLMTWEKLLKQPTIKLYAGDIPDNKAYHGWTGLSITKNDATHISHDIIAPFPLPDNSVDAFQAEDVFEHIQPDQLAPIINEIFRVLKPQSLFRLSIPDYGCDVLFNRSIKDDAGAITFDPGGGGSPQEPGHVWFPRIDTVKDILKKTAFGQSGNIDYLHYYDMDGSAITNKIDYSKGHVQRTPDFDKRVQNPYRPMSMVIDLSKGTDVTDGLHIPGTHNETVPGNEDPHGFPRFSFITIVLNGMPFLEYAIKAVYDFAHEIVIVEGAVETCMFAANPDGSSKDGTVEFIKGFPDPENKIKLIQGQWPEKVDMQNRALEHVTGDYIWLVDSDEIYKHADLVKVGKLIQQDRSITQINFIPDNFWKGFDFIFVSPLFFEKTAHYRRVFKFAEGAKFSSHRPPTLYLPGADISTEEMNLVDGNRTREMGIIPFHYSYIYREQVTQKIELYNRYGWGRDWGIDLKKWYNECFLKWTPSNRDEIESEYPVWTGDRNSHTEKFNGIHPNVMREYIKRFHSFSPSNGEYLSELQINNPPENIGNKTKTIRIAEDYAKSGMKVGDESAFAVSIQKLFQKIRPKKIIETGTYLGTGTTAAIASAIKNLALNDSAFYSIEVNPTHYQQAQINLSNSKLIDFVKLLNGLSVPRTLLPTIEEIEEQCVRDVEFDGIFVDHREYNRALLYWRETNFENVPDNLLVNCLEEFDYTPDFILLDSGGHMGNIEFNYIISRLKGKCYIALDDINHIKHHKSFLQVRNDPRFKLITSSEEKFGFCIAEFTPSRRLSVDEVKKILWIRTDSIGDNILASSMLPYIGEKYKNAAITVVCQKRAAGLYEASDSVDNVVTFDRKLAVENNRYTTNIIKQLRALKADIAFNSVYSREPLTDRLTLESGAGEKIAFRGDLSNISPKLLNRNNLFYNRLIESNGIWKHELERHGDYLKELGIKADSLQPLMWISPDDEKYADNLFRQHKLIKEKTIALFSGAQYDIRIYDHYGKALEKLCKDKGYTLIALGSSGEHAVNRKILDAAGIPGINLCGETTLGRTAAVIKRCKAALGSESGLSHMACAVGTPNIVLVGGGHFGRFMPYSPLTSAVCLPLECFGCNWQCKFEKIHCIKDVAPEVMEEAIKQTLELPSATPRIFMQGGSLWHPDPSQPQWMFFDKCLNVDDVDIIPVGELSITIEQIRKSLILTKEGESYYNKGQMEKAEEAFKEALSINEKCADAHNNLGVLYCNGGDKEKALDHYELAVKYEPFNITFHKNKADFHAVELGDIKKALQIYVHVLSIAPDDIDGIINTGQICAALQRYDDAKDFYKRALEIEPWNELARQLIERLPSTERPSQAAKDTNNGYEKIQSMLNNSREEEAFEALKLFTGSNLDFALAHNDLGVLYFRKGEKNKALLHYVMAAELQPENITFQKNLADFYAVELGRIEEAMKLYIKVLSMAPGDLESLINIGHICAALNKYDDAVDFYRKALDNDPGNQTALQHLAALQDKLQSESPSTSRNAKQESQAGSTQLSQDKSNYYGYSRPEVQALVPENAKKILDIGCGAGVLGEALKKRQNAEVWGVETIEGPAARAEYKLDRVIVNNIENALPSIPDNYFDAVIFADILEHLKDPEEILKEIKRKLNKGGNIIASIPNVRHWSVLKDLIEGRWDYQDAGILDRTHLRFFTKQNIVKMFQNCGYLIDLMKATAIRGENISDDVISALASAHINTSTLKEESNHYQYLVRAKPEKEKNRLTSLVVLTCNNLDYTKKCIESVFRHTEEPFELIVVDNASSDGTVEYLEAEVRSRKPEIRIIKNNKNVGFAAGNNQGMAAAKGAYILLMNNDIVVTAGWLDKLVQKAELKKKTGIVGPMSNYVNGPQMVKDVGYDTESLEGLDAFAASFSERNHGKSTPFPRVIGFCMLIKREVIEKIGGLDENYGPGNFEDDDYCLRSSLAGFETTIAMDCFIHHFGSKTFEGEKIDYNESMLKNWDIFKEKWEMPQNLPCGSYDLDKIGIKEFDPHKHYRPLPQGDAAAINREGESLFAEGRLEEARDLFIKALEINSDAALYHNNLGVAFISLGDKVNALNHYEKAVRLQPHNLTFRKNLAEFYYAIAGDINKAIEIYTNIIAEKPGDVETLSALGQISIDTKRRDEAKIFFKKILEEEPGHIDTREKILELEKEEIRDIIKTDLPAGNTDTEYLISAIVSTYNSEKFIRGCLESLENQTIAEKIEIIVVNSGSAENEEDIVIDFQKRYSNIKYIRTEQRESVYTAWDRGIKSATGKYITNSNTDDRHNRSAFEVLVKTLEANPDKVLAYADMIITATENETFDSCTPIDYFRFLDWNRKSLLGGVCFMGSQPMWRKSVHDEYGFFDDTFITSGDYEFWLRISQTGDFIHVPILLGLYLKSPDSLEHSNRERQKDENRLILQIYNDAEKTGNIVRRNFHGSETPQSSYVNQKPDNMQKAAQTEEIQREDKEKELYDRYNDTIIIVTSGKKQRLKKCIDNIQMTSKKKCEVIIVNSNLNAASLKWLKSQVKKNNNYRIREIGEGENMISAINGAVEKSTGRYLTVINDSAIVTGRFISGLHECFETLSGIALSGPMTNNTKGRQLAEGSDDISINQVNDFAASFMEANRGRYIETDKLAHFCFTFEKSLTDKIGLLDDKLDSYEIAVEDYCLRARLAGLRNIIAGNIFIHKCEEDGFPGIRKGFELKWSDPDLDKSIADQLFVLKTVDEADRLNNMGELDKAVKKYLAAIGKAPDNENLYFGLSRMLLDAKQYKGAIDGISRLPTRKDSVTALLLTGYCKEGLEQHDEAKKYAALALEKEPESAMAMNLRGIISYNLKNNEDAENFFRAAIESDRSYGEPYSNLGVIKWLAGAQDEAIGLMKRAVALSPISSDIVSSYHAALSEIGDFENIVHDFRQIKTLFPWNKQVTFLLIDALIQQGNYESAMKFIQDAVIRFGAEDDMLSSAMAVRNKIKPKDSVLKKKGTISVCMIVKNEEQFLAKCLNSLKPVADEMIIVDTGSTDKTKAIASLFGATIYDYKWNDDFSAARNFSLSKAEGEWILVMDADEVISPRDYERLKNLTGKHGSQPVAYSFVSRNYTTLANPVGWTANDGIYRDEEASIGWVPSVKVRLFKNDPKIRFKYPVHEMVEPSIKKAGISIKKCSIPVHHYGKLNEKADDKKGGIYYEIGKQKLAETGDDPAAIRELAIQAGKLEKQEEAIELWERYLRLDPGLPEAYVNISHAYMQVDNYDDALSNAEKAMEIAPRMKEAKLNYSTCKLYMGEVEESISALEELVNIDPDYLSGQFKLAAAYCCGGRKEEGIKLFNKLKSRENIQPAGLAIACHAIAKKLLRADRGDYAALLLESAIEAEIANKDIISLLSECNKAGKAD